MGRSIHVRRRRGPVLLALAALATVGALALVPEPAAAADAFKCEKKRGKSFCELSPKTPLPLPVYEHPRENPREIVGYLTSGGKSNWFIHQTVGERVKRRGVGENHWWAKTLTDVDASKRSAHKPGYVSQVWFRGGEDNHPDEGELDRAVPPGGGDAPTTVGRNFLGFLSAGFHTDMCLDRGNPQPGVYLWTCARGGAPPAQNWHQGAGTVFSRDGGEIRGTDELCLTAESHLNRANVLMRPCTGSDPAQRWYYRPDLGGSLQNGINWPRGACLDADATDIVRPVKVQMWGCNDTPQQHWLWW
jgi:Ricin-type beta-trefoil lectin domain